MITAENGITINYIGQKTDDLYISEIRCNKAKISKCNSV